MKASRSPYIDVAKYEPNLTGHVQDILVQNYAATSVSSSNIRFNIRAPGVKSLMDSEVLLFCPMEILPKAHTTNDPELRIKNSSVVKKSYPSFWDDMKAVGLKINI